LGNSAVERDLSYGDKAMTWFTLSRANSLMTEKLRTNGKTKTCGSYIDRGPGCLGSGEQHMHGQTMEYASTSAN
jgi:hypothetical protein